MPEASFLRPGRLLRFGAAFAVLIALACYLVAQYSSGRRAEAGCRVVSGKGQGTVYRLSPEQAVNTSTISAVGTSRGMPEQAVTIALATAIQESGLRNLDHGDRDSLGLFQQRPSQGWGTRAQIMDPAYAAGQFYQHLAKVPDYDALPLTEAAQRVQHSGFPRAYAKHEGDARLLAAAFTGRTPGTLSCSGGFDGTPGDPEKVRRALVRDFGSEVLSPAADSHASGGADRTSGGAAAPGEDGKKEQPPAAASGDPAGGTRKATGTTGGGRPAAVTSPGSGPSPAASPGGERPARGTVTVPVAGGTGQEAGDGVRRGWELAHWAVAHSSALGIERVDYAGRRWNADRDGAAAGWQTLPGARQPTRAASGPGGSGGDASARSFDEVLIVTTP